MHPRRALGALLLAALTACRPRPGAAPDARRAAPDAAASATPDAAGDGAAATIDAPDEGAVDWQAISDWADPAAVSRLAEDCRFPPPPGEYGRPGPLHCEHALFEQACTVDPCLDRVATPCRRVCARQCGGCDAACREGCERCRGACRDDGCRRACAASCGACLQGCLRSRDRCVTAGCAARHRACARRVAQRFEATCRRPCVRCYAECERAEEASECRRRCLEREGGCPGDLGAICDFEGAGWARDVLDGYGPGAPAGG